MLAADDEFAPAGTPTESDWRDALQKGLGRVNLWIKAGRLPEKSILLDACLNDLRFDRHCESSRGHWLFEIVLATDNVESFREPILAALAQIADSQAAGQLCEFCVFYARGGDARFRSALKRIVADKPISGMPWLGEEELVELDGIEGFRFAAEVRGRGLANRDWDWDDDALVSAAIEKLGETNVIVALNSESGSSNELRRFAAGWQAAAEKRKTEAGDPNVAYAKRTRLLTASDVVAAAETGTNGGGFLRGWGMRASAADLKTIAERLFSADQPKVVANYLRVFTNRPLPEFDERLLALMSHSDYEVRRWAFAAAAMNSHPTIRQFALAHLADLDEQDSIIRLFIRNFQTGDEELLCSQIRLPEDRGRLHWLLMGAKEVLRENPSARGETLALRVYRCTPCAICRQGAVKFLTARRAVPQWLIDECAYDSNPDARSLVANML